MSRFDPTTVDVEPEDIVAAFVRNDGMRANRGGFDPLAGLRSVALWEDAAPLVAFARLGHALAHAPGSDDERRVALDAWDDALLDAYHGRATHPLFVALAATVRRRQIPIGPLADLMLCFRAGATVRGFPDFAALETSCRLGAGSAARLVAHLAGESDEDAIARCEELAVAVRLVDIVADLGRDAAAGRVMIPQTELRAFGVTAPELTQGGTRACCELVAFQVARARAWLARSKPAARLVVEPLRTVVVTTAERAEACLTAIEGGALDPFSG
ncbi:MAG: squalene/phytoene synthase family protein [Myxococcota bacterium]